MSQLWFTSDLHFMHDKVAGIRGFWDMSTSEIFADAHDKQIIANINSKVDPEDHLWILGDLSLKKPNIFHSLFKQLNGHKHVVWGNHDYGFGGEKESYKYDELYRQMGVESSHDFARKKVGGEGFLMSHFPYDGDHTDEDRMKQYRLQDFGVKLLHGHTHGSEKVSKSSKKTMQIHVGLDAWNLFPVNSTQIMEIAGC